MSAFKERKHQLSVIHGEMLLRRERGERNMAAEMHRESLPAVAAAEIEAGMKIYHRHRGCSSTRK